MIFKEKLETAVLIFITVFSLFFIFHSLTVRAGTLSCSVASSCAEGTVMWYMSGTANAHASLSSFSGYGQMVCCTGVSGLSNACFGSNMVTTPLLYFSSSTNAHASQTQGAYTTSTCLSVPSGGSVSVGYQNDNCSGYDTIVASISSAANAQIGDSSAYSHKICASAVGGGSTLSADIVNESFVSVGAPTMNMNVTGFGFSCQTQTGGFGSSTQQIYVNNNNGANNGWTLTLAASAATATWDSGSASTHYDFNDSVGSGCTDGADADNYGGQMTVDPSVATLAVGQCSSCTINNISKGSSASFVQDTVDSITLLSATASSDDLGDWTFRGVNISQKIPAEQTVANDYTLNMVLTITAN